MLRRYDWTLGYAPSFALQVDAGLGIAERHEPITLSARG
jgi:hypothetical protein